MAKPKSVKLTRAEVRFILIHMMGQEEIDLDSFWRTARRVHADPTFIKRTLAREKQRLDKLLRLGLEGGNGPDGSDIGMRQPLQEPNHGEPLATH